MGVSRQLGSSVGRPLDGKTARVELRLDLLDDNATSTFSHHVNHGRATECADASFPVVVDIFYGRELLLTVVGDHTSVVSDDILAAAPPRVRQLKEPAVGRRLLIACTAPLGLTANGRRAAHASPWGERSSQRPSQM
jgi:hypothetical protein